MQERIILGLLLACIGVFTAIDIVVDIGNGAKLEHLIIEVFIALNALAAFIFLIHKIIQKNKINQNLEHEKGILQDIAENLQQKSKIFIDGLTQQIDKEFDEWRLSPAEREIALFLLKGLDSKEIAEIRQSSEKTVRHQISSVYKKANLSGRNELQAYFLEDLLAPQ